MKYRFADIVIDCSAHCVMRRVQVVRLTNFHVVDLSAIIARNIGDHTVRFQSGSNEVPMRFQCEKEACKGRIIV